MGVFDSVYVTCRNCGEDVEFQSKAGECYCNSYRMETAPKEVAADIIGNQASCGGCGNIITMQGRVILWVEQPEARDQDKDK